MREHTIAKNFLVGRICHTCANNRSHGEYPRECSDIWVLNEDTGLGEPKIIYKNDSCDWWNKRHAR